MAIVSGFEIIVAIRIAMPPNVTPEQAGKMLSSNGVNLPIGLVQFVRKIDVAVVAEDEPFTVQPPEDGGAFVLVK